MSENNFVFVDAIYRSRMTLLDILEGRGYSVDKYRKFSPAEAAAAVAGGFPGLGFKVYKKDKDGGEDKNKVCDVRYTNVNRQKQHIEGLFNDIPDEKSEDTEVVIMMTEPVMDAHHNAATQQYTRFKETNENERRKLRVSFFCIYMIVVNPLHHVLVPKHEIVPSDQHKALMESLYITSKSKFPEIKFHVDPIARCIGAVPGDIVKITRASASAGEAVIYRVCAP